LGARLTRRFYPIYYRLAPIAQATGGKVSRE
jgi:hypothetical protein